MRDKTLYTTEVNNNMKEQYRYELIGRMQAYWDALSCTQKVDMYFEACGADLRMEFWRVPECPEYRHDVTYREGEFVDLTKENRE